MSSDIIRIPAVKPHLHIDLSPIRVEVLDSDSRPQEWRPEIQQHPHMASH